MQLRYLAAFLGLALPLAAGCRSDEALNAPDLSNNGGLLQRYVSMGNSITAGFQSAGINDSTQLQSYAVLFAAQAKAPFFEPLLNKAGCPPPFVNNVTQMRVPELNGKPTTSGTCDLRTGTPLPYVSNVAVPGVTAFGVDNIPSPDANPLTQFILGGRTQVKAMMDAQPTFVSVWIGNNDVLGSLTNLAGPQGPGNPALVTSEADFEASYGPMLDSIQKTGAKAVLIGVEDVTAIPYASLGAIYWCLKNAGCPAPLPPQNPLIASSTFTVANNCAPNAVGTTTLIPWTVGVVRLLQSLQGAPGLGVDCSVDTDVITGSEVAGLSAAVAGFNAYIQAQAQQRRWAYLDINPTLLDLRGKGFIPGFPDITQVSAGKPVTFGPYFSLDGVHPSAAAHRVIADSLISAVNQKYGTTIPFAGP